MAKPRKQEVAVRIVLEDDLSKGLEKASKEVQKLVREFAKIGPGLTADLAGAVREMNQLAQASRTAGVVGARSLRQLSAEARRAHAEVGEMSPKARQAEAGLTRLGRVSVSVKNNFGGLAAAAVGAGTALLGAMAGARILGGLRDFGVGIMEAAGNAQKFQLQLESVKGSSEGAADAYQEIAKLAAATPFQLDELVQASVVLGNLTRNTNAGVDDLKRLGNAAAIVDQPITELAVHYGRIIEGLKNNVPIGESTQRLNELGVISGSTMLRLREMVAAGTGPQGIPAFLAEFEKFDGSMERLSRTIPGLASTIKDNFAAIQRDIASAGATEGFGGAMAEFLSYLEERAPQIKEATSTIGEALGGALEDLTDSLNSGDLRASLDDLIGFFADPQNKEEVRAFFQNIVGAAEITAKAMRALLEVSVKLGNQLAANMLAADLVSKRGVLGAAVAGDWEAPQVARGIAQVRAGGSSKDIRAGAQMAIEGAAAVAEFSEILGKSKVAGSEAKVKSLFATLQEAQNAVAALQQGGGDMAGVDAHLAAGLAEATVRVRKVLEGYGEKFAGEAAAGAEMGFEAVAVEKVNGKPVTAAPVLSAAAIEKQRKADEKAAQEAASEFIRLQTDKWEAFKADIVRAMDREAMGAEFGLKTQEAQVGRRRGNLGATRDAFAVSASFGNSSAVADRRAEVQAVVDAEAELASIRNEAEQQKALDEAAKLGTLEETEAARAKIIEYYATQETAIRTKASEDARALMEADAAATRAYQEAVLGASATLFNGMSDLAREGARDNKALGGVYKATATAEAIIATYLAASKALASVPFPGGFIAAAGITMSGMANVARIQSTKFARGGVVGGDYGAYGSTDTTPAVLAKGEMVLNAQQQKNLWDTANGSGGRGGASIVYSPNIPAGMDSAALEKVLREDKERFALVVRDLGMVGTQYRMAGAY